MTICRIAGCRKHTATTGSIFANNKDVIGDMNHGMCAGHFGSLPVEFRKKIAAATSQRELTEAYESAWLSTWEPVEHPDGAWANSTIARNTW